VKGENRKKSKEGRRPEHNGLLEGKGGRLNPNTGDALMLC
jgi:hypothetical protein